MSGGNEKKKYQKLMDSSAKLKTWSFVRYIGRGTFGAVMEVRSRRNDERCALKAIHIPVNDEEYHERRTECGGDLNLLREEFQKQVRKVIEKEIGVLEACKGQPNIVQIYEYDVVADPEDPVCCYVLIRMELLLNLHRYLADNKTHMDALRLFRDIAQALVFLEKRRMLHRDIKPANIMVSRNGVFKLTDFGEARALLMRNAASTKTGTPNTMAPEIYHGERYDSRVDIYSLGMTLYNCLYGMRWPFMNLSGGPKLSSWEACEMRLQGSPVPPLPNVDAQLNRIILKCVEYQPERRYSSAVALLEDIKRLMASPDFANRPLVLPPYTGHDSNGGGIKALPFILAGAGALVLIAVVILIVLNAPPNPSNALRTNDARATAFVRNDSGTPTPAFTMNLFLQGNPANPDDLSVLYVEGDTLNVRWTLSRPAQYVYCSVTNASGEEVIRREAAQTGGGQAGDLSLESGLFNRGKVYSVTIVAMPAGGTLQDTIKRSALFIFPAETTDTPGETPAPSQTAGAGAAGEAQGLSILNLFGGASAP